MALESRELTRGGSSAIICAVTGKLTFFLAVASGLLASSLAEGESLPFAGLDDLCGPYEGTGVFGEALHVQPLGAAGTWPICAVWSSGRTAKSPYFGFGWSIPALESRFVPLDVRRWAFYQPDGYVRIFVQADQHGDDKVLTGGPAWTAVLKDDLIRVTADPHDGGPKSEFTFRQGRLVRMVCEEGNFEVKYTGRVADGIVSRGKTLLEVTRDSSSEKRVTFRFNGGRSQVVAVCRPATVFGPQGASAAPMPSQESCLATLETPDGKVEFSYGGENGEAFFQAGGTRWTWDPHTRKILSCGDWSYIIGETQNEDDEEEETPTFDRRHANGGHESYASNRKTGLFEQSFTNGTSRAYKVFTSGPLAYRRVRWTKETDGDGPSVRTDYTYNEAGRVVYRRITREGENAGTDEVWLDESGAVFRRRVDGQEVPLK